MTSDPEHLRDEEIETVRGQEAAGTPAPGDADGTDAGDRADAGDAADQVVGATPAGATDTGVMMDSADSGELDRSDVPEPSGASDTGLFMDSRDTGTIDRTDVAEDADADEADR
jgi:hypothetical protein